MRACKRVNARVCKKRAQTRVVRDLILSPIVSTLGVCCHHDINTLYECVHRLRIPYIQTVEIIQVHSRRRQDIPGVSLWSRVNLHRITVSPDQMGGHAGPVGLVIDRGPDGLGCAHERREMAGLQVETNQSPYFIG